MKNSVKVTIVALAACFLAFQGFSQDKNSVSKSSAGMVSQIYKAHKDTVYPRTGNWVSLNMRYSANIHGKDSVLFDNKLQLKGAPVRFQLPPSDFKGDIYEGVQRMTAGDSANFIVNADSLFTKTFKMPKRPAMIDSNAVITFFIHLLSVDIPERMKGAEQVNLKKYLTDNKINVEPTKSGVYVQVTIPGDVATKIDTGSIVKLHFAVGTVDGNTIFSSMDRPEPLKFTFGEKFDTPGLEQAIASFHKGTKARVIVPSTMAFGEAGRGTVVPPYTTLVYYVEIVDIQTKAQAEEEKNLVKQQESDKKEQGKKDESVQRDQYIKDHNITAKPTADGLYYIEKTKGTGTQAEPGKKVKVHYTGTLLNGKKFDSSLDRNEPFEFTLGKGMVIRGWDEGIAMMKQGGKATLIIPSSIGYNDRDMGDIPAFSTLVFDVELLEVISQEPAPMMPEKK